MRTTPVLLMALLSTVMQAGGGAAAPKEDVRYHIVFPRHAVRAGEHVRLRLVPPAPKGIRVLWGFTSGTVEFALTPPGVYRAPYVIPVGTPPAKVSASFSGSGSRARVTTEIELMPGSVPGAEDCLSPGQSFSTAAGGIEPGYSYDQPPELIRRVDAVYPRSAFARGVESTLTVQAFICRTGRVLDAYVPPTYLDPRGEPIERDPKLVEAALAAVRQYVFRPATLAGKPVSVYFATPVAFRR